MRTITQLKEDINILIKKLGDMRSILIAENRDPNEDERRTAEGYLDEIDNLEKLVKLETITQRTLDRVHEPTDPPDKTPVDTARDKAEQDKRDSFASSGEFFQAVMRAGTPGGPVDPRLSTRAASGLQESVPSDGGFLVYKEMAEGLMANVWDMGMVLPRINKLTLSGNKNGLKMNGLDETSRADGSRWGGILSYWVDEADEKTKSKPKFRQIELSLHKVVCLVYATDELLDDAAALAQTIDTGCRDELNFKLQNAIINGSGAGQPLGILNSGCVVPVAKESGQNADTIVYENVMKMWSRMMASSRPNAIWLINQNCEPQLFQMSLSVGTGGAPVYLPAGGAAAAPYGILFGRPVVPIEQCPVLGDVGDIILADFSKYIGIDKGGMQKDISIHVRFIYDESVFRFVYRFDGQPMLASAINPFTAGATTATDTLSHFVTLEARG